MAVPPLIPRLAEINRILFHVAELKDANGRADREGVLRLAHHGVLIGRRPDHAVTIDFCRAMGFLTATADIVTMTTRGTVFFDLRIRDQYDLSPAQQEYLLEAHFFAGEFLDDTRELLRAFEPIYEEETYKWNRTEGSSIGDLEPLLAALEELGVVTSNGDDYQTHTGHKDVLEAVLTAPKGQTPEEFAERLAERRELGALAELAALEFERNRLRTLGHHVEAECVQHVSKLQNNAGYDIASYNGKRPGLRGHDRFIEVKGSHGDEIAFIWSDNELVKAKKHGPQYWIYFVGGVDVGARTTRCEIVSIQDPHKHIFAGAPYTMTPHGYQVRAKTKAKRHLVPLAVSS